MFTERRVVDNRVFLLGLDKLYRDAMKQHERGELLRCSRRVADALHATPADVPIEGYYAEDESLREYFRLVRALQDVDESATSSVVSLPEFRRLREVMSAPLYGRTEWSGKLLPAGSDALSQALRDTFPDWTVVNLAVAAHRIAVETDETPWSASPPGSKTSWFSPPCASLLFSTPTWYLVTLFIHHDQSMIGRSRTSWPSTQGDS